MPKKELDQPFLAASGTTATDITTRSALHRHMAHAISATTFNLSGTLLLSPTANSPVLSIPSAVQLMTWTFLRFFISPDPTHFEGFDPHLRYLFFFVKLRKNCNWELVVVNGLAMEELHLNRGVRREEINASAMEKEEYRLVGREGVREGRIIRD